MTATINDDSGWLTIASVPNQHEVLVCNDCLLGWWAVAIQNALGEWHYAGLPRSHRMQLSHEPTHWRELPSISPISIRRPKAMAQ